MRTNPLQSLRGAYNQARHALERSRNLRAGHHSSAEQIWETGTEDEIAFWRGYLQSGGDDPSEHAFRLDPDAPLQQHIIERLPDMGRRVRMLDVGAGPLTSVGKRWPGHDLDLVPIDALADQFDALLAEAGVEPPARTLRCDGERLTERFPEGSFDVACSFNALDHCYDPMLAIRQMVAVVRPGGVVLLRHYANEAEAEAYHGLHRWNFDWRDDDCLLWQPRKRWSLSSEFSGQAAVAGDKHDGIVTVVLTRL